MTDSQLAGELTGASLLPKPYYQDEAVTIYHGDCRDVLPLLGPGRKAVGVEIEESYCEIAARRVQQEVLPLGYQNIEQRERPLQATMFSGVTLPTEANEVAGEVGSVGTPKEADRE